MPTSRIYIDQLGREIEIPFPPQRIISLVPSQTELLHDLGLQKEVVGITKFCIHPEQWYRSKTRVGGTKKVNFEKIEQLIPDLIIANKEENTKEEIEQLASKYPVWISDINDLASANAMISSIGEITKTDYRAQTINRQIIQGFKNLKIFHQKSKTKKVVYLIWHNPIITVGKNTFIGDLLNRNNLKNVMLEKNRYPELPLEELIRVDPDLLFLSSEPFPFKEKHAAFYRKHLPHTQVVLVDGEMFSWYGSRLIKSSEYFINLAEELIRV